MSPFNQGLQERYENAEPVSSRVPLFRVEEGQLFNGVAYGPSTLVVLKFAGDDGPVETYCSIENFLIAKQTRRSAADTPKYSEGLLHAALPGLPSSILGLVSIDVHPRITGG